MLASSSPWSATLLCACAAAVAVAPGTAAHAAPMTCRSVLEAWKGSAVKERDDCLARPAADARDGSPVAGRAGSARRVDRLHGRAGRSPTTAWRTMPGPSVEWRMRDAGVPTQSGQPRGGMRGARAEGARGERRILPNSASGNTRMIDVIASDTEVRANSSCRLACPVWLSMTAV
ncbi:hypothetical protein Y023_3660 [Burkholderia pseudomallei A79D]|nr:hypothetical protein Y023_3660 [Burkholderia pseudomallei A79D]KGY01428.1 hypothetical protein X997_3324 [Burkholderia pseudomallei A79C]